MARMSTIRRLPKECRELIEQLRQNGRTIDEIHSKLAELGHDISRSTLGRYTQKLDLGTPEGSGHLYLRKEVLAIGHELRAFRQQTLAELRRWRSEMADLRAELGAHQAMLKRRGAGL